MDKAFIQCNLLTKAGKGFSDTLIYISKPTIIRNELYSSFVEFSNIAKYNAEIRGADEFNAVECAIKYVNSICKNSADPEFFSLSGESLLTPTSELS